MDLWGDDADFCQITLTSCFDFLVTRTGRTSGPIVTINASYDVILGKDVPFGGYVDTVSYTHLTLPTNREV